MKENERGADLDDVVIQVDGKDKKKKGGSGFQVGKKKLKTKMTPLAKAKAAQAMEIEK